MKTNKNILTTMLFISFFAINVATMPKAEAYHCDYSISFINSICQFITGETSDGDVSSDFEEQSSGDTSSEVSQQYETKIQDINTYMASHNGSLPPNIKITGKKKNKNGSVSLAILDESSNGKKGLSEFIVSLANDGQSFAPVNLFHNDASKSDSEVLQEEYDKLTTPVAQGGENELSDVDIAFLDELQKKGKDIANNEEILGTISNELGVSTEAIVTAVAGGVSLAGIYLVSSSNPEERKNQSSRTQTILEKATARVEKLRKKYGFGDGSVPDTDDTANENKESEVKEVKESKDSSGDIKVNRKTSLVDLAVVRQSVANLPDNSANLNPAMFSVVKNYILENNSKDWNDTTVNGLASCIIENANKYNISALAIVAQLKAESNFNPAVTSYVGACGIAQFMPSTARGFGINPWDVGESIKGQCEYMSNLMKSFGDYSLAWAGYNAGGGAVEEYGGIPPYSETQNYVSKIAFIVGKLSSKYNQMATV